MLPPARWFADLAQGSGLLFFALQVQPELAYEYISEAVTDLGGVTPAEALADPDNLHSVLDPDYVDSLAAALATKPGEHLTVELKWRHRVTGNAVYTRCWAQMRQRDDGSVVLEGTVVEITELREVETELRHSEERHRLLAENAYDVIWTMAMDGTITYVSPAILRMRGLTPEEAKNQTVDEIHPPESAANVTNYYAKVFDSIRTGDIPPIFRGEQEYYRKDGSIMTGELQVIPHIDADGEVVELLGVTRDISESKVYEAELTRLAITDPVTGVWNRRHGKELLEADLETAQRVGQGLCLLMIDVDKFKPINDTYGHQFGDRVLAAVADRLRSAVRGSDVVARWGGDEFVVLLRACDLAGATRIAESVRARVADLDFPEMGRISVSIGAAELNPGEDADALLERADAALYEAKRAGRNAVHG